MPRKEDSNYIDLESPIRKTRSNDTESKSFNVKDIIIILLFLMGIAAIYTNVNERLVKLETKGDIISQQLVEMKIDSNRSINKLEEMTKSNQNQIRDVEQLIVITKQKN